MMWRSIAGYEGMYEELIVALNRYFEGYELKRGRAERAPEAQQQVF